MGRLLANEQRTTAEQRAGTQAPFSFSYVYNLSGGLVEEAYPSGRVVRNTLNVDGELSQVQSKKNTTSGFFAYADAFEYDASGAVLKMQLGNGHWETAAYDPKRLQVTALGLGITRDDRALLNLEFAYNSDGLNDNNGAMRLQRIIVGASGSTPAFTATQSYGYDFLNRISSTLETVSGNQVWNQSFNYDRYGNRRFAVDTTTLGSCPTAQCNPSISTVTNRFLSSEGYAYDASGSVTRDAAGNRFGYDAEGRQKEFFSPTNQTTSPDATYEYDGAGHRIKKTVGSEVTIFAYDAGGKLSAEYSTTVVSASDAKVSYLTADHLGSPRMITDQYGRVSSRKDFTAFGEEIRSSQRVGGPAGNGYDPPGVRQDYTGYEKDSESGLEYAQARYYNTGHGRFTSVDPLTASASMRNPQTFNRYSYVINSPYRFIDPLGLALIDIGVVQTTDPYLARYLENHSTYVLQQSVRQPQPQSQTRAGNQSQTHPDDSTVPKALIDLAAQNPIVVYQDGKYVGVTTLTPAEVQARINLMVLAYTVAVAEGIREVQRENGENIDVVEVQSNNGTQMGESNQSTTGATVSGGSTGVTGSVTGSESTSQSSGKSGSLGVKAIVVSGVAAAAADRARLATARQELINAQSPVVRDVTTMTSTVKATVDVTKGVDVIIRHGSVLGKADGRLSYDRTRILQ